MSVYVDPLMECEPNPSWRWRQSCHMFADNLDELHAFAKRIGLKRTWFQDHRLLPHYDLTANMRSKAILHGAAPTTQQDVRNRMRQTAKTRNKNAQA